MTTPDTQLDWLTHDIKEINRILRQHDAVFEPLADLRSLARQTLAVAATDLFLQSFAHGISVSVLIREDLYSSALVVQRAMYEASINLHYLTSRPDAEREATIFMAYTHVAHIDDFGRLPGYRNSVRERGEALGRIPKELSKAARERKHKWPHTWSGLTVSKMADVVKMQHHEGLYGVLSGHSHASRIGDRVKLDFDKSPGSVTMTLGDRMSVREAEFMANAARRLLANDFVRFIKAVDGPPVVIRSESPHIWQSNPRFPTGEP